jgi:hypothetical protein
MPVEANTTTVKSPSGRLYTIDLSDPNAICVYDAAGHRMLRVSLKGTSARAMLKRITENITTGAPAYLAAWPPKDVDRIIVNHAIANER